MGAQLETMGRSDHQAHTASNLDDPSRFVRKRVAADPRSAARARAEFGTWLETHLARGADRFSDVLLAVNEAIANAAEFAYCDASQRGTLDVGAAYDHRSDGLAVTVDDRGHWRQKVPAQHHQQLRGRGIPLMEALADEVTIDRTPHGTRVTMTWTDLTRRP
ncbi:ATP-binding protein [Mycobacterium seoulense]|uniref:Anti-sigma regulatory factor n=2 Tax=Mycobacterium seoulense TaxID=386911 RepID=A0A7I7P7A5_9MYCO|nr:ATP-binding protein [Mycobacterium seoulense]MCV7438495.1 ATP-binding protein [Mycobacterium seoulense]BBY03548.1 anti-sigma regulatory factor [Mycobacterium seoulense]